MTRTELPRRAFAPLGEDEWQVVLSNRNPREICELVGALGCTARDPPPGLHRAAWRALQIDVDRAWKRDDNSFYREQFPFLCDELTSRMAKRLTESTPHARPSHPAYAALGWWYREEVRRSAYALRYVPRDRPDFADIAAAATVRYLSYEMMDLLADDETLFSVEIRVPADYESHLVEKRLHGQIRFEAIATFKNDTQSEGYFVVSNHNDNDSWDVSFYESPLSAERPLGVHYDPGHTVQARGETFLNPQLHLHPVDVSPHAQRWSEIPPAWG